MRSAWRRNFVLGSLVAALLAVMGCSRTGEVAAAPSPVAASTPPPALAPNVAKADSGLTVSGPLIVEHQLDVLAQRDGMVAELKSEAGAHVHAGELLAQFDDRQLAADLEGARAKTRSTEADLKNWEAEAKVMQADYE